MKKIVVMLGICFFLNPFIVEAKQGCCSHHGGVSHCGSNGKYVCNDGTYSPSCTCTPTYIYGCTDRSALNYNPNANQNDGSCTYQVLGCTNKSASNYNHKATKDDGSCEFKEQIKEQEEIPYKSITKENPNMKSSEKKVIQKGVNGKIENLYDIVKDSKNEIKSKILVQKTVIKEAMDEIIEVGTKKEETKPVVSTDSIKTDEDKNQLSKNEKNNTTNEENNPFGNFLLVSLLGMGGFYFYRKRK